MINFDKFSLLLLQFSILCAFGFSPINEVTAAENDFTFDNMADVLTRDTQTGTWSLVPMNGRLVINDSNNGATFITTDLNEQLIAKEDFTGDGKSDLLLRNSVTGLWRLYELQGRSTVSVNAVNITSSLAWQPQLVKDFTRDGKADVLLRNTSTGEWALYPMNGFQVLQDNDFGEFVITRDLNWQAVGMEDFTGDGQPDMLFRNATTGLWAMSSVDGRTLVTDVNFGAVNIPLDLDLQPVSVRDITGDGRGDVLVRSQSTGRWYLYPLRGRTIGSDAGEFIIITDLNWELQDAKDYTGDGRNDFLFRNRTTGLWYMSPVNGRTLVQDSNYGVVDITTDTTEKFQ